MVVSFLNTFHLLSSIANVATDFSAVDEWLNDMATDPSLYLHIASCASALLPERSLETSDPNDSDIERMLAFVRSTPKHLPGILLGPCRELVLKVGGEALVKALGKLISRAALDALVSTLTGVKPVFDLANDAVPGAVSYFAPSAARSEYHVRWERTRGGQAYIAQVSEEPLPVAEFTYAQQRSFRVELDGSRSQGEGLRYEWAVGGARIGTGEERVHDFGEAGAFEVTLTVTDRNGVTAAERGRVRVTSGRVPVVSRLTCTPTGEGKAFSMHAELSDADDDIDSVEWFSHLSNAHPDEVTGADRSRVTLSAPGDASYTRAKVRVVDARGNEAERSCAVELDPGPPLPRISEASAEEGEALEFTVTLDRAPAEGVTYYYATYRGTAGSDDYDGHLATALRFGAGERSKALTVRTTEDTRVERDETFHVYVTDSTRALTASAPARYLARATGVIRDDDALEESAPLPRISGASAEEGEALEFTVTLDRAPAEGVTYYYATYRGTAGSDDYDGHLATALRFGAGERSKTLTVRTTEDTRVERDETFHVYVTDSTRALTARAPTRYLARATGVIRDDDAGATDACTGPTVSIPDAALRAAVERVLGKARGASITPEEMRGIDWLMLYGHEIRSLTGLQCATGLEKLYLFNNQQLSDLTPLAGLTALEVLHLDNNQAAIGPNAAGRPDGAEEAIPEQHPAIGPDAAGRPDGAGVARAGQQPAIGPDAAGRPDGAGVARAKRQPAIGPDGPDAAGRPDGAEGAIPEQQPAIGPDAAGRPDGAVDAIPEQQPAIGPDAAGRPDGAVDAIPEQQPAIGPDAAGRPDGAVDAIPEQQPAIGHCPPGVERRVRR